MPFPRKSYQKVEIKFSEYSQSREREEHEEKDEVAVLQKQVDELEHSLRKSLCLIMVLLSAFLGWVMVIVGISMLLRFFEVRYIVSKVRKLNGNLQDQVE